MKHRMDMLITAAVRQNFSVRQTRTGVWIFWKGNITMTFRRTPRDASELVDMIRVLQAAGLRFPEEG